MSDDDDEMSPTKSANKSAKKASSDKDEKIEKKPTKRGRKPKAPKGEEGDDEEDLAALKAKADKAGRDFTDAYITILSSQEPSKIAAAWNVYNSKLLEYQCHHVVS